MDFKPAFIGQFKAALAMLRSCVTQCPAELWVDPCPEIDEGDRVIYRPFWRIAFHAVYFAHLYLGQNDSAFVPPPNTLEVRKRADFAGLWGPGWELEPFELPKAALPVSQADLIGYIDWLSTHVEPTVEGLDMSHPSSGFPWYPNHNKLEHELLNLRHLQGHVGQLEELLMARGLDPQWISRA
jgi:hypothetical protein